MQAIDRDLNYSDPATLTLKVVPPFYLRASFLVPTVGGGAILLVIVVIQAIALVQRRRQVLAYQREAVQELQDARRMQMSLMPDIPPQIEGVEIAGKCVPANTVGGDFYDYLQGSRPTEIALVVGDVTGKKMNGAMNAVMADGILHAKAEEMEELSPAVLLAKLNDVLKTRTEKEMNVTMVIGLINAETQTLTLANAAHHAHPLLLRDDEGARHVVPLKLGGFPLGMKAGVKYREQQFPLQSDDVLILMTDGIIEAQDDGGTYYADTGRLEEVLSRFSPEMPAAGMVEAVITDAIDFGGGTRDDDMTVVVTKIL